MALERIKEEALLDINKDKEWKGREEMMRKFLASGVGDYLNHLPGIEQAFVDRKDMVCCMDEGTTHAEDDETKLAMAGSGILFPVADWDARLDRVARIYIEQGIKKVTSHDGCGAARIAWTQAGGREKTDFNHPDKYGQKWARELQERMNKILAQSGNEDDSSVEYEHISAEQMVRPREFHNARTVWFDASGRFNPGVMGDQLPKGFLIDYALARGVGESKEEQEYPFAELGVAIGIALGGHGFGSRFTEENPFVVVIVARSEKDLEDKNGDSLKDLIENMEVVKQSQGKVRVEVFIHNK